MDFQLETFKPLINKTFILPFQDAEDWELTLTEITEFPDMAGSTRKRFSLVFRVKQTDVYLQQATYLLKNADLGELQLFLVPLGPAKESGFLYESVFT